MLRDDVLEGMYQLAYCFHPDNGVALSVTLEACERLVQQIHGCFQRANIMVGEPFTLRTRPPTEHERQVVHRSLALFTPWGAPHLPTPAPNGSILETHFDGVCGRSDWDRIHALIDPGCGGLPRLIREYNESFPSRSTARLEDPDHTLAIPCFAA